jgi:hypothetical protein
MESPRVPRDRAALVVLVVLGVLVLLVLVPAVL